MQSLISIVIPTCNRAGSLPAAIDSVLYQSFGDWEIVIADDGSTDNTQQVIQPYLKDPRIQYFYKANSGVSATRNVAVEKANSEYIFFLDSDDLMLPGTVAAFVNAIRQTHADLLFSACRMVRDGVVKVKSPADLGKIFNHVKGLFLAGAFCIRKQTFMLAGGYNITLKFGENYEFGIRVCQLPIKTAVVDHISADYFIHSHIRTSNSLENKLNSNLFILKTYSALLNTDAPYLSTILSQTGYFYSALGHHTVARGYFGKSFLAYPFNARNIYRFLTSFINL